MSKDSIQLQCLKDETKIFFKRHWPDEWGPKPNWGEPWRLHKENPAGNKQGVYALLNEKDEVIYIGVGAALGGGRYEGFGIGARTSRYTRVAPNQKGIPISERKYVPAPDWQTTGLAAIVGLGFDPKHAYLAYGLEAYLLSQLAPKYNKIRSARRRN